MNLDKSWRHLVAEQESNLNISLNAPASTSSIVMAPAPADRSPLNMAKNTGDLQVEKL